MRKTATSFFLIVPVVIAALLFAGCSKNHILKYETGKNQYTMKVDGIQREFIVHVPASYDGSTAYPVVIMFHGGGQDGELMYNISGWTDVGDSLGIITVYPSALQYCVVDDGVEDFMSQWSGLPGGAEPCAGVEMKDDMHFIQEMIAVLNASFNIDSKRIYSVGFSNGGQFSATCALYMSDVIAAAISCEGGGSLPVDTTLTPIRLLPVMLMFGNRDGKLLKGVGLPSTGSVPMGFSELYSAYPYLYAKQPKPYIDAFQLDTTYTLSGDTNSVVIADYSGLSGNPNNVFKMVEVKGLEHEYPNGTNYPLQGAFYHWQWLKNFTLP